MCESVCVYLTTVEHPLLFHLFPLLPRQRCFCKSTSESFGALKWILYVSQGNSIHRENRRKQSACQLSHICVFYRSRYSNLKIARKYTAHTPLHTSECICTCVWENKKGNGSYRESQTQRGRCNEVIILLLSAVRKLFLTLIDASGQII